MREQRHNAPTKQTQIFAFVPPSCSLLGRSQRRAFPNQTKPTRPRSSTIPNIHRTTIRVKDFLWDSFGKRPKAWPGLELRGQVF